MVLSILFDEIPRVLIPVLIFYIPIRITYYKKHHRKIDKTKELINLAFIVYICAITTILVIPRFEIYIESFFPPRFGYMLAYEFADMTERSINILPFASISQQFSDWKNGIEETHPFTNLIANLCLMIPMPVFIKLINNKIKNSYCLLITFGIIVFCETSQYFRAGRACDIDDVILNTVGGIIGILLFKAFKKLYYKMKNL